MGEESNTTKEKKGNLEEFKIALFTEKGIICSEQKYLGELEKEERKSFRDEGPPANLKET